MLEHALYHIKTIVKELSAIEVRLKADCILSDIRLEHIRSKGKAKNRVH